LKGGSDAKDSNTVLVDIIHNVLKNNGIVPDIIQLLPPEREAATELMNAVGYIDVLIPRGSKGLINAVRNNAKVPVIETGAGVVHTYFDKSANLEMGRSVITNAKTRRVSVCNALDCLIVHRDRLGDLAALCAPLAEHKVLLFADGEAFRALDGRYPFLQQAQEKDFGTEFLDYKMAVRTVGSAAEAVAHITRHGSGHSESIVTEDAAVAADFQRDVDAACVYVNAPTSFSDGGEFGLGAEIGISTQKLHARGPMGLEEITTYKWLVEGNGQIRQA
jgi:glutamate-5-semialdehyde dehydrogenase